MSTTHRTRVHLLPPGEHIAPLPARRYGTVGRLQPGGLPPTPNRTTTHKWTGSWRRAAEPFNSRAIRIECAVGRRDQ